MEDKTMKKIRIINTIIACFMLLFIGSCSEDNINLEPIGAVESGFFQTDADMDMAVKGIYQKICFFYTYPGNQNNYIQQIFWLPSDDMMAKSPSDFATDNFDALTASNTSINLFFNYAYQLIARANVVLEKIDAEGATIYAKNPTLMDKHRGEALFLRSWVYFNLWNVFGTAPIVNERITDINDMYPPSTTGNQLLDQAITDLGAAVSMLPASWDAANKEE